MVYDSFGSLVFHAGQAIFEETNTKMYRIQNEEEVHCLECGEPVYGRSDKKFCSDNCRNRWHGHLRYAREKIQAREMQILARNYSILESMLCLTGGKCPFSTLEEMGFKKEYVTRVIKKGKHLEYRCFDFAYNMGAGKLFNLHRLD